MWQRIKTAIILVAIVGIAMFAFKSHYPFLLLLIVGIGIGAKEWQQFLPTQHLAIAKPVLFSVPILGVLLTFASINIWAVVWGISLVLWIIAIGWILRFPKKVTWFDSRLAVIGAIFLISAMTAMYALWQQSPWWLMYVFMLVWAADSGAYFVGRKLGKRKMAPNVSPNKSIEGLAGGVLTGLIGVSLVTTFAVDFQGKQLAYFIILSIVTIIISVFGDLFESMLKRQADIKDSGTILPGHGGVLDRIDSLLSATPLFAFGFCLMDDLLCII